MILYHGTSRGNAQVIVGPPAAVNVNMGGGELGRGFYMGDSVALAAQRAINKYGVDESTVLMANVPDHIYGSLNIKILTLIQVQNTWGQLKRDKTTDTYTFGVDVVYGPYATHPQANQHKFESSHAAAILNSQVSWTVL